MLKVLPKLWIGNRQEIINCNLEGIIDIIIYLGQEMSDERLTHHCTVPVIHYPLNDGHNPDEKYRLLLGIITYISTIHNVKILLCCRYGKSRSPSILLAHLIVNEKWEKNIAHSFIKRKVKSYYPAPELFNEVISLK